MVYDRRRVEDAPVKVNPVLHTQVDTKNSYTENSSLSESPPCHERSLSDFPQRTMFYVSILRAISGEPPFTLTGA